MNTPPNEEALFQAAASLEPAERAALLDRECEGHPALRARLDALLAAHDEPNTLASPDAVARRPTIALDLPHNPTADDAVGLTIGRYKLLERLGEGGCGVVYVAEQSEPVRRRVALKLIKPGMDSKAVIARFEAERQALAMMDHPNIAKVLDAGTTDSGRPFFVMELVRGIRITEYCDREKLSVRDRLDLFIRVCQAIQHAHQKGIIHRDIKPSNILVTLHDGVPVPKVIDFGIAKAVEGRLSDATVYTQLHQFLGTPAYMSPEQAEMSGLDIDTRSDIYSLGVLLYELLTGVTPFDAKELLSQGLDAMRRTIREQEPPSPSTRLTQLQATPKGAPFAIRQSPFAVDLDWIVMKCLDKDRARRYETANGLAADLKRHLNHEPVVARPPSFSDRFQKTFRRNRAIFVAGALASLALIVGTVASVSQAIAAIRARQAEAAERIRAESAQEQANRQRERAELELWKSQLSQSRALRIAATIGVRIEGAKLLRELTARPGLSEDQQLALREEAIGQFALLDLAHPTSWIEKTDWRPLAWASTQDRYVRRGPSNELQLCSFPSGQPLASFLSPPGADAETIQFSPRDTFVAARFPGPGGETRVWRTDNQQVILRGQHVSGFDFAHDETSLLLITPNGLAQQPLPPTRPWRVLQPGRPVRLAALSPDGRQIAVLPGEGVPALETWDVGTGEILNSYPLDFGPDELAWHPESHQVALGGDRGRLAIISLVAPNPSRRRITEFLPLTGHQGAIRRLRFAPDGQLLMSYSWDRTSILWDAVSGRALLREPRMLLSSFDRSGSQILALREWPYSESPASVLGRAGYRTLAGAGKALEAWGVWASPDGRLLAIGCHPEREGWEGDCLLWDIPRGRQIARLQGICAQFSADSRTLYTFERYGNNHVRSYDVSSEALAKSPGAGLPGQVLYRGGPGRAVNTGTITADGRILVVAASDSVVFLDLETSAPPQVWGKSAHAVSLSGDGRWIATMLHNQVPVLSRTEDGRSVFWGERGSRIEISPDSRHFSQATMTGVWIHSLDTLQPIGPAIPLEIPGAAPPLAFSPDGRTFVTTCNRTHPRLFETHSRRLLATFPPPQEAPLNEGKCLNFSPDGQWLLAAKSDGETMGWNLPRLRDELSRLGLDWTLSAPSPSRVNDPQIGSPSERLRRLMIRPKRSADTDARLIDLSQHFNASLTEHWHPGEGSSDLSELPQGVHVLAGVPFDLRGIIQCGSQSRSGSAYPRHITDIPIKQPVRRLHFLHAAINAAAVDPGTVVGIYALHGENGAIYGLTLRVGHELADWWTQDREDGSALQVAWTGQNPASRTAGRTIRLLKTTWENPAPGTVLSTLDLVATQDQTSPFLLAITVE